MDYFNKEELTAWKTRFSEDLEKLDVKITSIEESFSKIESNYIKDLSKEPTYESGVNLALERVRCIEDSPLLFECKELKELVELIFRPEANRQIFRANFADIQEPRTRPRWRTKRVLWCCEFEPLNGRFQAKSCYTSSQNFEDLFSDRQRSGGVQECAQVVFF